jgi:hypothetical protein
MQVAMSVSGGNKLKDSDGRVVAEWEVPWGLWKEVALTIRVGGEEEVQVWTGDYDPRSQEFEYRGARYFPCFHFLFHLFFSVDSGISQFCSSGTSISTLSIPSASPDLLPPLPLSPIRSTS